MVINDKCKFVITYAILPISIRQKKWYTLSVNNFYRIFILSHADGIAQIGVQREGQKRRGILSRLVGADDFHSEKQLRPRRCALSYAEITRLAIFRAGFRR